MLAVPGALRSSLTHPRPKVVGNIDDSVNLRDMVRLFERTAWRTAAVRRLRGSRRRRRPSGLFASTTAGSGPFVSSGSRLAEAYCTRPRPAGLARGGIGKSDDRHRAPGGIARPDAVPRQPY